MESNKWVVYNTTEETAHDFIKKKWIIFRFLIRPSFIS